MNEQDIKDLIVKTLQNQRYAVYNTIRNDQTHSALVGFVATPDLSKIIILTPKNTRKYVNTQLNHKVNLFITTTTNDPADLESAITISILGKADVGDKISPNSIKEYKRLYFEKNTHMNSFRDKINDIIVLTVDTYEVTKNYQKSVIQTNAEITSLFIRQLPGVSLAKGLARGKAIKISSFSDLRKDHENTIVIVDKVSESDTYPDIKIKGLVLVQESIPSNLENILKEKEIPIISGIGRSVENVKSGSDVSINGTLGLLIFHEIKY